MAQNYPAHIYEPIRREVANSYLRHELRKYFPSVVNWQEVDGDIEKWFDGSAELYPVRDYWNGVYGIMMGFKLYNQLLSYITAENVIWSREKIGLADLTYSDFGEYIPRSRLDNEPVIVTQKEVDGMDKLVVYDGNNRVNRAIKSGETEIESFIGRFSDSRRQPENYWLSTSVLMEVTEYAKMSFNDVALYKNFIAVLAKMLSYSESGKYEMKNRVLPKESEFKKKLLTDLGLRDRTP
jgi:hypothetical protein